MDDQPPADPNSHLRVVKPKKVRPLPPTGMTISQDTYELLAKLYLAGERTATGLARKGNVNPKTARRVITIGYPAHGWPALRERALLQDKIKHEEESKVYAAQVRAQADGRVTARKEREGILRLGKAGYAALFAKWQQEAQRAQFVRPESKVVDGRVVVTSYVSAHKHVLAGARLMAGWATFAELEEKQLELGAGDQSDPSLPAGMPAGLAKLDKADLDFIIANGKLPPHLSEEEILGIAPEGKQGGGG